MSAKSMLQDMQDVQLAITLIELGARLQFIEAEVSLSRERLLRLYKEVQGGSPPKGLLPFSVDWYLAWMANIHASLFYNLYLAMLAHEGADRLGALIKSFRMYLQQVQAHGDAALLDFTRAATLVKFFESDMLQLTPCTRCTGLFVARPHEPRAGYVCVLCRPPSRAGKKKRSEDVVEDAALADPT
jgi:flagellar transcriptional activator FlhC